MEYKKTFTHRQLALFKTKRTKFRLENTGREKLKDKFGWNESRMFTKETVFSKEKKVFNHALTKEDSREYQVDI